MYDFVVARDVPGINSGKVRRLYPAQFFVTIGEDSVAVSPLDQITSPNGHRRVPVPQFGLRLPQKLVRQFEVEIVADALRNNNANTLQKNIRIRKLSGELSAIKKRASRSRTHLNC